MYDVRRVFNYSLFMKFILDCTRKGVKAILHIYCGVITCQQAVKIFWVLVTDMISVHIAGHERGIGADIKVIIVSFHCSIASVYGVQAQALKVNYLPDGKVVPGGIPNLLLLMYPSAN